MAGRRDSTATRVLAAAALLLLTAALGLGAGACGGGETASATTAADYAGLWVNPETNNEIWLHASAQGDAVTLRWEREWSEPVTQKATVGGDGTLTATAVPISATSDGAGAFRGRLTSDGGLDLSTTTRVTGVDAEIPVTLHFVRGSQAKYAVFAARMKRNLEQQRVGDAFWQALQTIREGIQAWSVDHFRATPPASAVRPGGAVDRELQAKGKSWPRLGDGRLVTPGKGRGQYVYRGSNHGYRLTGFAEDGQGPMTVSTTD